MSSEDQAGATPRVDPSGDGGRTKTDEEDARVEPKTPVDGPDDVAADPRRQWLLVGVVVLATLVIPALVYLRPPQLPYWVALLVFPLAPAVLLGGTAVYVAVTGRRAAATSGRSAEAAEPSGDATTDGRSTAERSEEATTDGRSRGAGTPDEE